MKLSDQGCDRVRRDRFTFDGDAFDGDAFGGDAFGSVQHLWVRNWFSGVT